MEQKVARYCGYRYRGAGICGLCLQLPPIYKAEALLLPPKAKDVKSANVKSVNGFDLSGEQGTRLRGVSGLSVSGAFSAFKNNLSSRSLQKKFIDEYGLMDILAPDRTPETRDIEILEGFSKMIKIEHVKRALENEKGMSVSMESGDTEFAAKLVNDYISIFDTETDHTCTVCCCT